MVEELITTEKVTGRHRLDSHELVHGETGQVPFNYNKINSR